MALELEMTVEETHGPTSQEPVGSAKSYPMRVRLSAQSMGYQDADETWSLLDFPQRRRLRRNEAAKTYTSDSLFADVDARHIEAPNLAYVRSTIAAGGGGRAL